MPASPRSPTSNARSSPRSPPRPYLRSPAVRSGSSASCWPRSTPIQPTTAHARSTATTCRNAATRGYLPAVVTHPFDLSVAVARLPSLQQLEVSPGSVVDFEWLPRTSVRQLAISRVSDRDLVAWIDAARRWQLELLELTSNHLR